MGFAISLESAMGMNREERRLEARAPLGGFAASTSFNRAYL